MRMEMDEIEMWRKRGYSYNELVKIQLDNSLRPVFMTVPMNLATAFVMAQKIQKGQNVLEQFYKTLWEPGVRLYDWFKLRDSIQPMLDKISDRNYNYLFSATPHIFQENEE